ncbi:MAG TPA: BrnT family toxin [Duganella sp.]|nr:BrnT family toxin [Duganella sp.]
MRFEWDQRKAKDNLRKHGISFEEASTIFDDPRLVVMADLLHSNGEDRFWAIGRSGGTRILLVCHCYRGSDRVRIFSARLATRSESKLYR